MRDWGEFNICGFESNQRYQLELNKAQHERLGFFVVLTTDGTGLINSSDAFPFQLLALDSVD